MKTRAKFRCTNVDVGENVTTWNMCAVYHSDDPDHENAKFNKHSPNGGFNLSVDNEHYKGEHPEPGKEYYFDISLAE